MIGGLVGAVLALLAVWSPVMAMTGNLPGMMGTGVRGVLIALAALIGFLGGSVVARRRRRDREHLRLFSGVTGGVAGGIIGAAMALLVTATYLTVYGHVPLDVGDEALVGLGLVAFTCLGFFLGAIAGGIVGVLLGSALKLASPRH